MVQPFATTAIGQGFNNLADALMGGPQDDLRLLQMAQIGDQIRRERAREAAQDNLATQFGKIDDAAVLASGFPGILQNSIAAGADPGTASGFALEAASALGGSNDQIAPFFVGSGRAIGSDDAFTIDRQNELRSEDFSEARTLAAIPASISAAGAMERLQAQQAFEASRPVEIGAGDVLLDPETFEILGAGRPTLSTERGLAAEDLRTGQVRPDDDLFDINTILADATADALTRSNVMEVAGPDGRPTLVRVEDAIGQTPPADAGTPFEVTRADLDDVMSLALRQIDGAIIVDEEGRRVIAPEFEALIGPARLAQAQEAAASALQASRNQQAAAAAFLDALSIASGSTFEPGQEASLPWNPDTPPSISSPGAPPVGHVEQGYQYVGGDPGNPSSWRPVP